MTTAVDRVIAHQRGDHKEHKDRYCVLCVGAEQAKRERGKDKS